MKRSDLSEWIDDERKTVCVCVITWVANFRLMMFFVCTMRKNLKSNAIVLILKIIREKMSITISIGFGLSTKNANLNSKKESKLSQQEW